MKSQLGLANRGTLRAPGAALQLAAMGLAAAVLVAAPTRSDAHPSQASGHGPVHAAAGYGGQGHPTAGHVGAARAAVWHGGEGHAVRADFHGNAGFHGGVGFHGPVGYAGWHGGDGRWEHGWHGGHYGWWYINAGVWTVYPYYPYYGYPYGYPYYGYPAPYGYAPPEPAAYNGNLAPQQQTWYWCDASRGYYPAVQTCPGGWRPVTPQAAPQPSAPPAPAPLQANPQ